MGFWRRSSGPDADRTPGSDEPAPGSSCPGLSRALERLFRTERPRVLLLGPLSGASVVFLGERGARVTVAEFDPPATASPDAAEPPAPFGLLVESAVFDLVLAWDSLEFVPPERLREVGQELRRVLRPGGILFALMSLAREPTARVPARFRIVAEDRVVREAPPLPEASRWAHANREIERALDGIAVEGVHLQRDQVREILAVRGG